MILLLGSVFSPAYAAARERGPVNPLDFAAVHVTLRGPGCAVWVQSEGLAPDVSAASLGVGRSRLSATASGLTLELDVPQTRFGGRPGPPLRGRVTFHPEILDGGTWTLAPGHLWSPIMPRGRAEVRFDAPGVTFTGGAYHDANVGDGPLERAFDGWQWLRRRSGDGADVRYRGRRAGGEAFEVGLRWHPDGRLERLPGAIWRDAGRTGWGLHRALPAESGVRLTPWVSTPFYVRSLIADAEGGGGVYEAVDLSRFRSRWVRYLLGFRTHREAGP